MGEEFIKKIRPLGCVLFILMAVLVTAVCLTAGRDPIEGYEPPESMDYYAEDTGALKAELEANVFPALPDVLGSRVEGEKLVVEIAADKFAVTRSAILYYFDEELFLLESVERQAGD